MIRDMRLLQKEESADDYAKAQLDIIETLDKMTVGSS